MVTQLERRDLGGDASFGGRTNDDEVLKNQAVIIVHGITNKITRFNVSSTENKKFFFVKSVGSR